MTPQGGGSATGDRENARRVGNILALDVLGDVSASGLEEGVFLIPARALARVSSFPVASKCVAHATDVGSGDDSGASDEGGCKHRGLGSRQERFT